MKLEQIVVKQLPAFQQSKPAEKLGCDACRNGTMLDFDFTMAFQPLVDLAEQSVFAYESLVRGLNGEGAATVFQNVTTQNIYKFDQSCRVKAIALAAESGLSKHLNINFIPGAIYQPQHCIQTTLEAAKTFNFPIEKINLEIVESEFIPNLEHLQNIINTYNSLGFATYLDDFGAGHANLAWLTKLSPNTIKIDISLIRDIDSDRKKQTIVTNLLQLCKDLSIDSLAEGVETKAERDCLMNIGISKQQGFYFAKPAFEHFVEVERERLV